MVRLQQSEIRHRINNISLEHVTRMCSRDVDFARVSVRGDIWSDLVFGVRDSIMVVKLGVEADLYDKAEWER